MGQKAKNAGKKKSKPSSNKLADTKSICGNVSSKCKTVEIIEDREMYEKMELCLLSDTINFGRYNSSIYKMK